MLIGLIASMLLRGLPLEPTAPRLARARAGRAGRVLGPRATPGGHAGAGVLIVRVDAPMYYANALTVRDGVKRMVEGRPRPRGPSVFELGAQDELDVTTTDALRSLLTELGPGHRRLLRRRPRAGARAPPGDRPARVGGRGPCPPDPRCRGARGRVVSDLVLTASHGGATPHSSQASSHGQGEHQAGPTLAVVHAEPAGRRRATHRESSAWSDPTRRHRAGGTNGGSETGRSPGRRCTRSHRSPRRWPRDTRRVRHCHGRRSRGTAP